MLGGHPPSRCVSSPPWSPRGLRSRGEEQPGGCPTATPSSSSSPRGGSAKPRFLRSSPRASVVAQRCPCPCARRHLAALGTDCC